MIYNIILKELKVKKGLLSVLVLLTFLLGTEPVSDDNLSVLQDEIRSLKLKNQELAMQNNKYKEDIKKYRHTLIAKNLKRAKLKLTQASIGTIVPLAGATSILALTYNDIRNYCKDIQDIKALEASMFGTFYQEVSEDETLLCSANSNNKEELLPALNQDSKEWIKDKYKKIEDQAKEKMDKWF